MRDDRRRRGQGGVQGVVAHVEGQGTRTHDGGGGRRARHGLGGHLLLTHTHGSIVVEAEMVNNAPLLPNNRAHSITHNDNN